jgi:hypothetical protein
VSDLMDFTQTRHDRHLLRLLPGAQSVTSATDRRAALRVAPAEPTKSVCASRKTKCARRERSSRVPR